MKANEAPKRLYLSKNIYSTYLYQVPDPDGIISRKVVY